MRTSVSKLATELGLKFVLFRGERDGVGRAIEVFSDAKIGE